MEVVDAGLSARPQICPARARQTTSSHAGGDSHAGTGDWRELGDLLRGERRPAQTAPLRASRSPGHGLGKARCRRRIRERRGAGGLPRLDEDEQQLRGHCRDDRHRGRSHRFRRAGSVVCGGRLAAILRRVRGASAARPHLSSGGGHNRQPPRRNSRSLVVDRPLRRRSDDRGAYPHLQWGAIGSGRCLAPDVRISR
jgi:hypothetical protein